MPSSREKHRKRHHSPSHSPSPVPKDERRHRKKDHHDRKRSDRHHRSSEERQHSSYETARKHVKQEKGEGTVSKWERDEDRPTRDDNRDGHDHHTSRERGIKKEPRNRGYEDERARNDNKRRENHKKRKGRNPLEVDDSQFEYGRPGQDEENPAPAVDKQKPDFGLSGKLTEDTNTYKGVVIKYNEPAEARKPKKRWRFYPFKGDESLPVLHLHRQSAYLMGRDRIVADIPVDHPSCSKQHAVLQFRLVEFTRDDHTIGRRVRPYVIDLGSTNGTYVNNNRIESQRYVELMEKDVLKFGFSSREYVLLTENTDTTSLDNDEGEELNQ